MEMIKMIFGYCRVSTEEQILDRQIEVLKKYNCDEIFTDKITGTKANNPETDKNLLKHVFPINWEHINFLGKYFFETNIVLEEDNLRKLKI